MVMAMRFKRLSNCIVFSFKVCCLVVALRIELSAIRLSDAGFFLLANAGAPALDYHLFSRVCRNRTALDRPKRPVPAITLHAR